MTDYSEVLFTESWTPSSPRASNPTPGAPSDFFDAKESTSSVQLTGPREQRDDSHQGVVASFDADTAVVGVFQGETWFPTKDDI